MVNTFEEPFGDIYGTGVWSEISKPVASNIHDNIVALASFNGSFTVLCCLLFLCFYDQQTYDINCGLQEKKGFLHAQDSLLNGMDISLS